MKQLVEPDLSVQGQSGLCLAYVQNVFHTPHLYPNATTGWQQAEFKHGDALPDVSVPVWFSYKVDGHVAVWVPGQGVYSTTAQGVKVFSSLESMMNYIGGGIKYLGWSEDLATVRLVEGGDMPLTPGQQDKLFKMGKRAEPTQEELTNQDYANNAGLAIDTVWNTWGEENYKNDQNPPDFKVLPPGKYKVN